MFMVQPEKILCPLIFLCLGFAQMAQSQNAASKDSLLEEASRLFDLTREEESLDTYLKVLEIDEDNFEALWRTSLLYARIGYRMDNEKEMMENYKTALRYAKKALEKKPDSGYSHFVNAVAHGRISDLSKSKVRIKKSHLVKKHAQKAIELIPEFAPAWHVYALWHSKVANVGSAQKMAAGVFSKGIPKGASNEKAEEYTVKAMEMDPKNELRYKLDLARHFRRAGQTQKAIQILEEVLQHEPNTDVDQWNLDRAQQILQKIS